MNKKQKHLVRIIAIVLAALLAGGAIISAIISFAYAEELPAENNRYSFEIEYMEEEQALRISQRLVYMNDSEKALDRVVFYAAPNMFRRMTALTAEPDDLPAFFPYGYYPGGIELISVSVNGKSTDWGFQGQDEIYLRAACDLDAGESCEFLFDYYLLITENRDFTGKDDLDVRLSNFCFIPAEFDENREEFTLNAPLGFTGWIDTPAASCDIQLVLPDTYLPAASGTETLAETEKHISTWLIHADDIRDFALCFGRRYRETTVSTDSGIQIRCLANVRDASKRILNAAKQAVEICEEWFGAFPFEQFDIVQSGYALGGYPFSGGVWLSEELFKSGSADALEHALFFAIANQYFGRTAYPEPVSDAWLSDSVSEYIAYLLPEETKGYDAYLSAINERLVDSLQLTIPGGLTVTSSASLFSRQEYEIVVLNRGAAVFHELRTSMGREALINGLRLFYEKGLNSDILTEMNLVEALDEASGKSWEKFLTDWVFNIGDYVNQEIDWLD